MIDQSREVSKLNSSAEQSPLSLTVIWTMAAMSLNSCFHASHPYHETGTDCDRPSDAVKSLNSEAAKTEEDTGKREQTFQLLRDHQELARPLARSKYEQNTRNNTLKGLANEPSPQRTPPSVSRQHLEGAHLPRSTTIIIHDRRASSRGADLSVYAPECEQNDTSPEGKTPRRHVQ